MILYVDGTVRKESRTRELSDYLLKKMNGQVEYVKLEKEKPLPMDAQTLTMRSDLTKNKDFSAPYFRYARQFARADEIILSAPYWDLSFPASVKAYLESICITGLTFYYSDAGIPVGMCRAERLYYVTTAGGTITEEAYGYGYVKALAQEMFGIKEVILIKAENFDIIGNDQAGILSEAKREIDKLFFI
ncbi:NAD(P)H-dependent oxidoreductase [Clostridium sp. Marseille-P3244]|uniref:NAD(P)H-dependent oxidoreductase n=1 Tax=Clostridium sp. Marseille-P3244 TaxID=1871020 RepID=UPI000931F6BB|nr:NAD(P)H-dependent oxidoreductase [Clostridium sp. Marseille-P3244]